MESQRVFLAFKLPKALTNKILKYQYKLDPLVFRKEPENQLHLTLLFLGELNKEQIALLEQIVNSLIKTFTPSPLFFSSINYGPSLTNPRLVWLKGKPNKSLEQFHSQLQQELSKQINFQIDTHRFFPHVTIARINNNFQQPLPSSQSIYAPLYFSFIPKSLWLIQSQLFKTGAHYTDLKEFKLLSSPKIKYERN